jgi:hypothetical protein
MPEHFNYYCLGRLFSCFRIDEDTLFFEFVKSESGAHLLINGSVLIDSVK